MATKNMRYKYVWCAPMVCVFVCVLVTAVACGCAAVGLSVCVTLYIFLYKCICTQVPIQIKHYRVSVLIQNMYIEKCTVGTNILLTTNGVFQQPQQPT